MRSSTNSSLWEKFDSTVIMQPDRIAIRFREREISYHNLKKSVLNIEKYLFEIGATPGEPLAIVSNKGYTSYALMLACLRNGMPYANLDPGAPKFRIQATLESLDAPKVIVEQDTQDSSYSLKVEGTFNESVKNLFWLDPESESIKPQRKSETKSLSEKRAEQTSSGIDEQTIGYYMFTSGSTGKPKGVAITHGSIKRFIDWAQEEFTLGAGTVMTGLNPLYFDNSVFDFYSSIFNGATLVPIKIAPETNLLELYDLLRKASVNSWFSVPSLITYLQSLNFFDTRLVGQFQNILFGGEAFPKNRLRELMQLGPKTNFYNVYGPTEGTCICSVHKVTEDDLNKTSKYVTLGKIAKNFGFFIDEPNEQGVGELVLTGPQISPGYIDAPTANQEKFGNIETVRDFGRRTYRTGDLVSVSEGSLYFEGRKDNQIKFMGYRIELEEIDSAMNSWETSNDAIAVFGQVGAEDPCIGLLFVSNKMVDTVDLLKYLSSRLPSYMLPRYIFQVNQLPRNANGKLSRQEALEVWRRLCQDKGSSTHTNSS